MNTPNEPEATTTTTAPASPFHFASMGRQYGDQFLLMLQERALNVLSAYLEKSSDPHAADISRAIDCLTLITAAAEEIHHTHALNEVAADMVACSVPDLVEVLTKFGHEWA